MLIIPILALALVLLLLMARPKRAKLPPVEPKLRRSGEDTPIHGSTPGGIWEGGKPSEGFTPGGGDFGGAGSSGSWESGPGESDDSK